MSVGDVRETEHFVYLTIFEDEENDIKIVRSSIKDRTSNTTKDASIEVHKRNKVVTCWLDTKGVVVV